ncbi:DNA-binding transcriptional regulator, LysR family [Promicromonospora umidemergens]|uniref:LysR family transcriptional regulator n=1 Tax=Promicromonospora umidemergens TaxID=629679 RepID=A0ABP8WTQ6_9MICO|nr:LysR family transcriptional regulator [Promicromonospora umidemergens]MCP2283437.1 DNA-binding transcriptional regulator, LysR family [Promicromonospora umidemergens]
MDSTTRRVLPMLPVLAALAETGQATAAAEILQMPQPTVSRILTRLGMELGVPVVERHGRSLRLTPAGGALVPHAAAVIAAATAGVESVRSQEAGARGTLTLAFQSTLGERVVPALVKAFLQDHPGVTFELIQTSRPRCLEALDDGLAEIALVSPLAERSDLTTLRLHAEPLVLVVPRGHRLATRAKVTFEETASETFVCMKPGYGMRTYLDDLAAAAGFTPEVRFEGDDLATLRGLVSAGLGVSVAPRDPHGAPGCAEIPITDPEAVRQIGACWPDRSPSALASSFQSLLRRRGRRLTEIGLRPHQG